jgi:DNA-binding transcriptional MerR regulator
MKYKIGEVSHIIGISTDLIRYYEKKGVVSPLKDENNRYRYYDAWDVNFLLDCIWYKKMGFGIEEIAKMSNAESYGELVTHLNKQAEEIKESVAYQQLLLDRIEKHTESVAKIKEDLGRLELVTSRDHYYYLNRFDSEFDNSQKLLSLNKRWEKYMPFTKRYFRIETKSLSGANNDYAFGFSAGIDYVKKLDIPTDSPVMHQKPLQCIHSAFESFGKTSFSARKLDFMVEYARDNAYKIAAPAFGNLICSIPQDGEHLGYFEAWLPVKEV